MTDARRRMTWHGVLLFLTGLVIGLDLGAFANPRMGLTAHTGTVLNGVLLIALGAAWDLVRLSATAERAGFWLLVVGSYGSAVGLVLAAALGTHDATPIHGAAQAAAPWAEMLVTATLSGFGAAVLGGTGVVLWGLRRVGRR